MPSDDNEEASVEEEASGSPSEREPLPPRVRRALAEARAKAEKAGTRAPATPTNPGSRWLALIPVTAAVFGFLLMMPRAVPPEDVPLPQVDVRALAATRQDDKNRASGADAKRLDGDILLVGTALRQLNKAAATNAYPDDVSKALEAVRESARAVVAHDAARGFDALRTLRAWQLEAFLAEVARFEASGKVTAELVELGGAFVERMTSAGWIEQNHVVMDEDQRRVAFKLVWASTIGAEQVPGLALTLDEQRVLYTLYLTHPHAPESEHRSYEKVRRAATTDDECAKTIAKESIAAEQWRAEKIKRLGEIDRSYPTAYALGVSYYRAGRYEQSVEQFRIWTTQHPEGPLSIRAKNHLKAAFAAYGPS